MSGILGDLAKNTTILKGGMIMIGNYVVSPILMRALQLDYYYTLGGLLGRSAEDAAILWSAGIGGFYYYVNRDYILKNKV